MTNDELEILQSQLEQASDVTHKAAAYIARLRLKNTKQESEDSTISTNETQNESQ